MSGEEEVRSLDGPRFDRLAAYAHPDARGLGAQLVSDWMFWFFPFDDWFDGPVGEDPARVREVIDPMVRFVYGDAGALPLSAPPLVRAFAELCGRSRMGMGAGWQGRFAQDTATYLFSYVVEAQMRRHPGRTGLRTWSMWSRCGGARSVSGPPSRSEKPLKDGSSLSPSR
ncbi:terpene synthase family protein [Streptomyces sp. NPDC051546]|uniref:terpene synthase family protein n=1 Tax=Streptomyces sp. NPDC051546 TaxID=3365655 RepID=UPI00379B6E86